MATCQPSVNGKELVIKRLTLNEPVRKTVQIIITWPHGVQTTISQPPQWSFMAGSFANRLPQILPAPFAGDLSVINRLLVARFTMKPFLLDRMVAADAEIAS